MSVAQIRDYDLTEPVAISARRLIAPFNGDSELYVHEQDFVVDADWFEPLPLDTPDFPDYPASYLVEESPTSEIAPGVLKWTRTYARIPNKRLEGESYAWSMPGIAVEAAYTAKAIDNANTYNTGAATFITTSTAHGLSVGQRIRIGFDATLGDITQGFIVGRTVLTVPGSTTLTVATILDGVDPAYTALQRVDGGRDPVTKVVHSIVQYDYWLPGIAGQPKDFQSIPIIQAVVITDADGKEVNTYATTTLPTKSSYMADVAAGKLITAESSIVRRWRGNIYERTTRFVRAQ